jgi:ABC-type nitrate/sulfonate/bicarbonate transport systems, periplasmic components
MEKQGIPEGGYSFVPLQPGEWGPALSSGAIDAVAALEPEASQLLVSGIARSVVDGFYAKLMPDLPLSGWWVSASYADRKGTGPAIRSVIDGYKLAVSYIQAHPDSAKLHFKKYVPIRDDALPRMQLNKWLTPETIDLDAVQRMVDVFAANKVIQARVSVDSFLVR